MLFEIKLVKEVLNRGAQETDDYNWTLLWCSSSVEKTNIFRQIQSFQKVSHFPRISEITVKSKLWQSLKRLKKQYNTDFFNVNPSTFVLPKQREKLSLEMNGLDPWIVKPMSSCQGVGIRVITSPEDLPLKWVVQKYLNPYLIQGHKFDLRIYVLITSYDPLKIFVYQEGLVRFAVQPYTMDQWDNKFIHLTNYSVGKQSPEYQSAASMEDTTGHKWSIGALAEYLRGQGIDMQTIWDKIYSVIIKTVIAAEQTVVNEIARSRIGPSNWFVLLGFDILLDQDLQPWLLEVNQSPGMNVDSPIDREIKSSFLAEMFDLLCLQPFTIERDEIIENENIELKIKEDFENENKRCKNWVRIFPAPNTQEYYSYLTGRYNELLRFA